MEVLQTLQEAFTYAIIRENKSDSKRKYLHKFHKVLATISFVIGPIFSILFLYFDANAFEEYAEAFYPLATSLCGGSIYIVLHLNKAKIFELIDNFNKIIQTREIAVPLLNLIFLS